MVILLSNCILFYLSQSGGCVKFSRLVAHLDVILATNIPPLRSLCFLLTPCSSVSTAVSFSPVPRNHNYSACYPAVPLVRVSFEF